MAFKSFGQYVEDKNGEFFVLTNDKDYADVVFLYRGVEDVLVADTHYLKTSVYEGYVHCCEKGCPACNYGENGIRKQAKMFIPLYNIGKGKIEFWDRTPFFESVLQEKVFKNYPNPSQIVFRITRNGAAGDRNTRYEIDPKGRNTAFPYEKILAMNNVTFPQGYSVICKEMTAAEMAAALNSSGPSDLDEYGYTPVPRGTATEATQEFVAPTVDVPTPVYNAPPLTPPPVADAVEGALPDYVPEEVEGSVDAELVEEVAEAVSETTADSDEDLDNVSF